jgi:cytochrome c553
MNKKLVVISCFIISVSALYFNLLSDRVITQNASKATDKGTPTLKHKLLSAPQSIDGCQQCHSTSSQYFQEVNGVLSGQHANYLVKQLSDMQTQKRRLPKDFLSFHQMPTSKMKSYATYFTQQAKTTLSSNSVDNIAAGKQLYNFGNDERKIPACMACHIKNGHGIAEADIPALNGQTNAYIQQQLKNFRSGRRSNDKNNLMQNTAVRLTDQDITALAHYITTLDAR